MSDKIEHKAISLAESDSCKNRFNEVFKEGEKRGLDYVLHLEFVVSTLTEEFIDNNEIEVEPESGEKLFEAIFQRQISKRFQRRRDIPNRSSPEIDYPIRK